MPVRVESPYAFAAAAPAAKAPVDVAAGRQPLESVQLSQGAAHEEAPATSHRGAALALLALTIAAPLAAGLAQAAPPATRSLSTSIAQAARPTVQEDADIGNPVQHRTAYTYNRVQMVSGDASALDHALRLIGDADRTVRLEASAFHGPEAERLADALEERAGQGRRVYLLVDPSETSPLLDRLASKGVDVRRYDTSRLSLGLARTENANVLIVDDSVAMSGSMRWDGENSQSYSVVVRGPAVGDLRHLWNESWGEDLPFEPGPPPSDLQPNALVRVLSNDPARQETKEALLAHIAVARSEIFIEAFALDDADVIRALKLARDRGVEVNVLLNKGSSDLARFRGDHNNLGAAVQFSEPNDAVSFRWFPSSRNRKLRAMVAMFDRETAIIASSHWTGRAAQQQHSVDLLVHGKSEISMLKWDMVADWQNEGIHAPVEMPPERFHR